MDHIDFYDKWIAGLVNCQKKSCWVTGLVDPRNKTTAAGNPPCRAVPAAKPGDPTRDPQPQQGVPHTAEEYDPFANPCAAAGEISINISSNISFGEGTNTTAPFLLQLTLLKHSSRNFLFHLMSYS